MDLPYHYCKWALNSVTVKDQGEVLQLSMKKLDFTLGDELTSWHYPPKNGTLLLCLENE